jgi:hypothetical protein
MGGGIIISRNSVVLTALTDPSFYASLSADQKTTVDAINATAPNMRTKEDLCTLARILNELAKHT